LGGKNGMLLIMSCDWADVCHYRAGVVVSDNLIR
jgi:hypothetical protein